MRSILITISLITINLVYLQGQTKSPAFEAYINKYKDLAIQLQKEFQIPASVKLAQGLLESAGGTSRLARVGNNHFGIKCKEEWRGGRMYHDDDAKNECFRTYNSDVESYLDHARFLSERIYYVSLFDLSILDYKGWSYGLQRCGYATDPYYGNKLVSLIETYGLQKYDRAQAPEKRIPVDDIYKIQIDGPGLPNIRWKRRIFETNAVHYISAKADDTYEIVAFDTRMKLKRLLKYNEVTAEYKLKSGDMVFIQAKKNQASKAHKTHIVRVGDSMHSISQIYGMKMKSLYKFNKLRDDYIPKPVDILKVRR